MKTLFIALAVLLAACGPGVSKKGSESQDDHAHTKPDTATQLPETGKWKADLPTKKNVALMVDVVSDPKYLEPSERDNLSSALQEKIDQLIQECRMQGPDHDALHKWLEEVLDKKKDLEKDEGYLESVEELRLEIMDFYKLFE